MVTALERTLGPMDDTVLHALIPFELGGFLDLYTFSKCIPGTVIAIRRALVVGRVPTGLSAPAVVPSSISDTAMNM